MASPHDCVSQPELATLTSDQLRLEQNSVAKRYGLPPIGSKKMSKHGIEWEVMNYGYFPIPAGLARNTDGPDCLPLVWPTNMSERLAAFLNETDHCTSKHILFIDTFPASHPLKLGENLHYAICSSNPDESYILLDTARAHETTFAHEIAHLWLNYVQVGGDGMRRLTDEAWDNTKYMQLNFVQSFVVDLKVNDLIAERGFDMSLITEDNIHALSAFRDAIALGYKPPTSREALLHSLAIADAVLEQKRWPEEEKQRLAGLLAFFEAATPLVYRTAKELVEIICRHGYESQEAIRKTLDECIALAYQATGDDFDIERDLEEAPLVEGMKDKYPHELPNCPVPLKLEIGKTMARNGIKEPCKIGIRANSDGMAEIMTGGGLGPLSVNFRLAPPQHFLTGRLPQRPPLSDGSVLGLPGEQGYNTAYPPSHNSFGPLQPLPSFTPPMYQAGLAHYMAGVALNVARARLMQQMAKNSTNLYQYAYNNPVNFVDPSGKTPINSGSSDSTDPGSCLEVGLAVFAAYNCTPQHACNHMYIHCMACCEITNAVNATCAAGFQLLQDIPPSPARWQGCATGVAVAKSNQSCNQGCLAAYPWPSPSSCCKCNPKCDMRPERFCTENFSGGFDCCSFLKNPTPVGGIY